MSIRNAFRHDSAIGALIGREYARLSDGHRKVADLILASPHQAALMTLEQMSQLSGLSKATVNRLGAALGLDGYQALKRLLRAELEETLRPVEGLVESIDPTSAGSISPWARSLGEDIERLRTIEPVGGEATYARACQLLATARNVFLAGFGSSVHLANYAAFCLSSLRGGCQAISDGFEAASRQTLDAGPDDVALQLGFARYSRDGIRLARRVQAQKTPIICITDSPDSPFAPLADCCFLIRRKPDFVLSGSGTGGIAVIEALLRGTAAALGAKEVRSRSARLTSALGDAVVIDADK